MTGRSSKPVALQTGKLKIAASRLGLGLWRRIRPADRRIDLRGRLLGDRRSDTVLLIWAIELPDAPSVGHALTDLAATFDQVVVVTDDWTFSLLGLPVRAVILLPDSQIQRVAFPGRDWETYLGRIRKDILFDWSPDFEITLDGKSGAQKFRRTPVAI